jgi:cytochrome P450/NADPH-cytochrome P450 reductase
LISLFNAGARIYVCGSTSVGNGVRDTVRKLYLSERRKQLENGTLDEDSPALWPELDEDAAVDKFVELLRTKERFVTDVFT